MHIFEYTATAPVTSSAVDEVHYNANTKELAVNLHDEVYVYSGVPESRYESLVNAFSVGRTFRKVKQDYGPSDYLGYVTDVAYASVGVDTPDMDDVLTVGAARTAAVGTPKGLTYAEGAKVDGVASEDKTFSLTPATSSSDNKISYPHTIVFESNGTKTVEFDAVSVDEAVDTLFELADMLGVEVDIRSVTVHFD